MVHVNDDGGIVTPHAHVMNAEESSSSISFDDQSFAIQIVEAAVATVCAAKCYSFSFNIKVLQFLIARCTWGREP